MKEIGQLLREARERQGIPLERVYETTRINPRYVAALEAGEFEVIPGEVYLKGFLREYARMVGLDGEELVRRYRELRALLAPPAEPVQGVKVAWQEPKRVRPAERRASSTGRRLLALVAVGLAALATGWALAVWSVNPVPEAPPSAEPPGQVAPPASPAPAAPPAAVPAPAPEPAPGARQAEPAAPVTPAPAPPSSAPGSVAPTAPSTKPTGTTRAPSTGAAPVRPEKPVTVTARLTERCWVRVEADGRVIYEGEAASGTQFAWGAAERLTVRLGNPAAVRLAWNGRALELPAQGPVTRTFTREGLVAPAPKAAPASAAVPAPVSAPAPATVAPSPASPSPAAEAAPAGGPLAPGTITIAPTSAP